MLHVYITSTIQWSKNSCLFIIYKFNVLKCGEKPIDVADVKFIGLYVYMPIIIGLYVYMPIDVADLKFMCLYVYMPIIIGLYIYMPIDVADLKFFY